MNRCVNLKDATTSAVIYYTLNGKTPTTNSSKYTTAITISASGTIKDLTEATGHPNSITLAAYIIGTPSALIAPTMAIATPDAALKATVNILGLTCSYLFEYGILSNALTSSTPNTAITAITTPVAASAQRHCARQCEGLSWPRFEIVPSKWPSGNVSFRTA